MKDVVVGNNARFMSQVGAGDVLLSDLTPEARELLEAALADYENHYFRKQALVTAARHFATSVRGAK